MNDQKECVNFAKVFRAVFDPLLLCYEELEDQRCIHNPVKFLRWSILQKNPLSIFVKDFILDV